MYLCLITAIQHFNSSLNVNAYSLQSPKLHTICSSEHKTAGKCKSAKVLNFSPVQIYGHTTLAAMALCNINLQNTEAVSFYHYSQSISPLEPLPARLSDMREPSFLKCLNNYSGLHQTNSFRSFVSDLP